MKYAVTNKVSGQTRLTGRAELLGDIWMFLAFNPMRDIEREAVTEAMALDYYVQESFYVVADAQ